MELSEQVNGIFGRDPNIEYVHCVPVLGSKLLLIGHLRRVLLYNKPHEAAPIEHALGVEHLHPILPGHIKQVLCICLCTADVWHLTTLIQNCGLSSCSSRLCLLMKCFSIWYGINCFSCSWFLPIHWLVLYKRDKILVNGLLDFTRKYLIEVQDSWSLNTFDWFSTNFFQKLLLLVCLQGHQSELRC